MVDEPQRLDLERADAYGRAFADVYDHWYDGVTDAEATARFVADHHPGGPVLELGVGSGRLAGPLADRGLTVIGLDGSADMLDRCPRRGSGPNPGAVIPIRADMRALPFGPAGGAGRSNPVGTVLIAFNTLFNLHSEDAQLGLLAELATLVGDRGSVVIEALDPTPLLDGPLCSIGRRDGPVDPLVVTATQIDPAAQRLTGQHLVVTDAGVDMRPWALRWVTPPQLDELAGRAGLALEARHGSWAGEPFTVDSTVHISRYRRAGTS